MRMSKGCLLVGSAVITLCSLAQAQPVVEAPKATLVPLSIFTVPKDLEVTLWAQSPMLKNPTNMDFDAQGRLWVTEGVNYRRHQTRDRARGMARGIHPAVLSERGLEPAVRAIPVEEAPQQCGRRLDLVDMGLRFGAHDRVSGRPPSGHSRAELLAY